MSSTNKECNINKQELPVPISDTKNSCLSPKELQYITDKGSNEKRGITPRNTHYRDNQASASTTFLELISKEGQDYKPKLEELIKNETKISGYKTVSRIGLSTVLEHSVCRPCVHNTQFTLFEDAFSEVLDVVNSDSCISSTCAKKVRNIKKKFLAKSKRQTFDAFRLNLLEESHNNDESLCVQCNTDQSHHYALNNGKNTQKKMMSLLDAGSGIESGGDIFVMMGLDNSSSFSRQYRRKRHLVYQHVQDIFNEELEVAMADEIESTLIAEKGLDYYLHWKTQSKNKRDCVLLTIGFDFGWQRAASRRLYNSKSGHGFVVGQYTGKIIACVVYSKNCKQCEVNCKKTGETISIEKNEKQTQNNDTAFKKELDDMWTTLPKDDNGDTFDDKYIAELEAKIRSINRHGSSLYLHTLDMMQTVEPSQLLTKMKDVTLVQDHICVDDFSGSSCSMESTGLLYLIKDIFWRSRGKIMLGTIVIDDDTCMRKVMSHPFTLPRGRKNKGGMLPRQINVPNWFYDPNHRAKCVGGMVFDLVSKHKTMNKLDALRLKKYYQYYIKQNRTKGIEHLRKYRLCPLEHLFDNHEFCDDAWCEKKRKEEKRKTVIQEEISNFDREFENDQHENMKDPQLYFDRSSAGYYRSKELDKDMYELLKVEFEKYVSEEKLKECCHSFDTNINECLNNIMAKYAPKNKHYSKSIELRTRIAIGACIYLVGNHHFWSNLHHKLGVKVDKRLSDHWLKKDNDKVKKHQKEQSVEHKRKRKLMENQSLREEVAKRQTDIVNNFTYESCVGMNQPQLVKKVKPTPLNECKHGGYGCTGVPHHKTERSKHCFFFKKSVEYIATIRLEHSASLKQT